MKIDISGNNDNTFHVSEFDNIILQLFNGKEIEINADGRISFEIYKKETMRTTYYTYQIDFKTGKIKDVYNMEKGDG